MQKLIKSVRRFAQNDEGPTAVEYAVMLSLIVVVCLAAIQAVGTKANVTYTRVAASLGS